MDPNAYTEQIDYHPLNNLTASLKIACNAQLSADDLKKTILNACAMQGM